MFLLLSCMSLASSWKCSSAVGVFFLLLAFLCVCKVFCSVAATIEDELVEGADLLFLDGEEICASGIGVRIVLGMGSNMYVRMCIMSSSNCS